jgi:predicted nucleic acid-binding protein
LFIFAGQDSEENGQLAREIIKAVQDGKLSAVTACLTVDEVVWNMSEFVSYDDAIKHGKTLFVIKNLKVLAVTPADILKSFEFMSNGLNPRDAIHAAVAVDNNVTTMITSDPDFEKKTKAISALNFKAAIKKFRL